MKPKMMMMILIRFQFALFLASPPQGLPTCPFSNFEDVRTRVGDLNCWNVSQYFGQDGGVVAATEGGTADGAEKVTTTQPTNLQKFYKKHKKMPAFRGRRGWCGCLQVRKRAIA